MCAGGACVQEERVCRRSVCAGAECVERREREEYTGAEGTMERRACSVQCV